MKINTLIDGIPVERDMTAEEEAQYEADCANIQPCMPTTEERVEALEMALLEVILGG